MSRSKHTRPLAVLVEDRLRRPHDPRGAGDASSTRRLRRTLKRLGIPATARGLTSNDWPLPRIVQKRPRPGFHHPASKRDITDLLRFFGAPYVYGLRCIELSQGSDRQPISALGCLQIPGRIIIYDQPLSPWRFSALAKRETANMSEAGAKLEVKEGAVLVHWTPDALRDFMLFDVLMHELGHHLLQHNKGKRRSRIARTNDHEAFAEQFSANCRRAFRARR